MSALTTTRDALTGVIREHVACCLEDPDGRDVDVETEDLVDALLTSGAVIAAAALLDDDALVDRVVRWLYNGPEGHKGPPPPRESLADLECDAHNAIEAIAAALTERSAS